VISSVVSFRRAGRVPLRLAAVSAALAFFFVARLVAFGFAVVVFAIWLYCITRRIAPVIDFNQS